MRASCRYGCSVVGVALLGVFGGCPKPIEESTPPAPKKTEAADPKAEAKEKTLHLFLAGIEVALTRWRSHRMALDSRLEAVTELFASGDCRATEGATTSRHLAPTALAQKSRC